MNTKYWTNIKDNPELALSYVDRLLKIENVLQPYIEDITGVRKVLKLMNKKNPQLIP